jgi:hypothetical protein
MSNIPALMSLPMRRRPQRTFVFTQSKKKPRTPRNTRVVVVPKPKTRRSYQNRIRNKLNRIRRRGYKNTTLSTQGVKPKSIIQKPMMTQEGMSFLKCAFAPPDFTDTGIKGIPDTFRGLSLLKKHRLTTTIQFPNAQDYYILLLPTPGYAYWYCTTSADVAPVFTQAFTGVPYSDFTSLFGNTLYSASDVVKEFRMVSNHLELKTTTNQMQWSGSITSFKFPATLIQRPNTADLSDIYTISGLDSILSNKANIFCDAFEKGVFTGCYNQSPEFLFSGIFPALQYPFIPHTTLANIDWGQLGGISNIPGFQNDFECSLIKISGVTGAQSAILQTWACIEYKCDTSSSVYDYQTFSPQEDCMALRAYREIILSLPVAVTASQNADMWARVLNIIRSITSAGSYLPGPYGLLSSGVNIATRGLQQLTL